MSRFMKFNITRDDSTPPRYIISVYLKDVKYPKYVYPEGTLQNRTDCYDGDREGTASGTYKSYKKALKAFKKYLEREEF